MYFPTSLDFLLPSLGRFFSLLVLLLTVPIAPVLLVPHLFVIGEGAFKILVGLEITFEGVDLGGHGNNLLVVWRFGTPLHLLLEPIILAHGGGHKGLMSEIGELVIKVVIIVAPDLRLEALAGDDVIGFKKDSNRAVNAGTAGKKLRVILFKLAIDLVDITIDRGCKYP